MLISVAWELFGEANGVSSIEEMRARIAHYRRAPIGPGDDPVIGCLFIRMCGSSGRRRRPSRRLALAQHSPGQD